MLDLQYLIRYILQKSTIFSQLIVLRAEYRKVLEIHFLVVIHARCLEMEDLGDYPKVSNITLYQASDKSFYRSLKNTTTVKTITFKKS